MHSDARGVFQEAYNKQTLLELGIDTVMVQDNQSVSQRGVLRGMHLQRKPHAMAKLVRVSHGSIQDIIVDCRPDSASYGKHLSVILTAKQGNQLFVPRGCAHGFLALEDNTVVNYKCDNYYAPQSEAGFNALSPELDLPWQITEGVLQSDRDAALPDYKDFAL